MTECMYIKNMKKNTIRELREIAKGSYMEDIINRERQILLVLSANVEVVLWIMTRIKKINLLDTPVSDNDKHPILIPNKYFPPAMKSSLNKSIFNELKNKVRSKINCFAD